MLDFVERGLEGVGITGELATLAKSRLFLGISKVQTLILVLSGGCASSRLIEWSIKGQNGQSEIRMVILTLD